LLPPFSFFSLVRIRLSVRPEKVQNMPEKPAKTSKTEKAKIT
jgi:hypothetical protein